MWFCLSPYSLSYRVISESIIEELLDGLKSNTCRNVHILKNRTVKIMWKPTKLLALSAVVSIAGTALTPFGAWAQTAAGGARVDENSSQAAAAAQTSLGSNSEAALEQISGPSSTISAVSVQNNFDGIFSFGDGVQCSGPVANFSGFYQNGLNGSNDLYGFTGGVTIPFGPERGICMDMASEQLIQNQWDTLLNVVKFCIEIDNAGYGLTESAPAELQQYCNYVALVPPGQVTQPPSEEVIDLVPPQTEILPVQEVVEQDPPEEIEEVPGLN